MKGEGANQKYTDYKNLHFFGLLFFLDHPHSSSKITCGEVADARALIARKLSLFFCHIHRVQDDFNTDRLILLMATSLFLKNNLKENAVSVIIQSMILEKQLLSWGFDYIVARFQDCGRDIWSLLHLS